MQKSLGNYKARQNSQVFFFFYNGEVDDANYGSLSPGTLLSAWIMRVSS